MTPPTPEAPARDGEHGAALAGSVRLTWVQPEDLVGHELRQAAQDGRDAEPLLRVWLAAGGHPAPDRAGASPAPADPGLRALAGRLLTELAALPSPSAPDEPESWRAITATWPRTPAADPAPGSARPRAPQPDRPRGRPAPKPAPQLPGKPPTPRPDPHPQAHPTREPGPQAHPEPHPDPHPQAHPAPQPEPRSGPQPHANPHPHPDPLADPAPRPDRHPDPRPDPHPDAPPHARLHPDPLADPAPRPDRHLDPHPDPHPDAPPHAHLHSHPLADPAPRPDRHLDPRPAPHPDAPPHAHPHPHPLADPAPRPDRHPDPHPDPHPDSYTGPRPGPQPRPRPAVAGAPRDPAPGAEDSHVEAGLVRRLEAAWVGRAVGCVLGKPVEKLPLDGIRRLARAAGNWPLDDWFTARGVPAALLAAYPWNRRSAPTSLAENIDGTPEDDDLNYPLLGLLLLQRHGKGFTTADVGRLWLDELPAGRTFTAERIAYRNLLQGLEPPATATHHNPFREWIGALIRADVHGWTNPGDPAAAAAQAYRDAVLTHAANGVYAALFGAAAIAEAATGRADVHTALRAGLAVVPPRSRLAGAVRHAIDTAARHTDFDRVVDVLHARHGHYHWVHAVPNTALVAAALTHADGDFTHSVCRAVSGGWDTDSNGATAGSLAALVAGEVPHRWAAPLKNRLATTVAGFDGIGFDTLAHLTAQEAARS